MEDGQDVVDADAAFDAPAEGEWVLEGAADARGAAEDMGVGDPASQGLAVGKASPGRVDALANGRARDCIAEAGGGEGAAAAEVLGFCREAEVTGKPVSRAEGGVGVLEPGVILAVDIAVDRRPESVPTVEIEL